VDISDGQAYKTLKHREQGVMKIWIGVTDSSWFRLLAERKPVEVNFWQPSGSREFRVLQPGEPFLFKLHSPDNYIVGGGYFVRYSALPASLAWEAFGTNNGVTSHSELRSRIQRYRKENETIDPVIGCNVLAEPFFFEKNDWIPIPKSWAPNIVQGKSYDTNTEEGSSLWSLVSNTVAGTQMVRDALDVPNIDDEARFGSSYLTRGRLGQGAFRVLVTDAYGRRCAVSGEKTLPVLEAAHIKPYSESGPHMVRNGILLRSDIHKLFDLGYVTVTPDLVIEVSRRLKTDWQNGREYYAHHGQALRNQPTDLASRPSREFLEWHNEKRFLT